MSHQWNRSPLATRNAELLGIALLLAAAVGCEVTTPKSGTEVSDSATESTPSTHAAEECDPAGFPPCGACLLQGCESECLACAGDGACVEEWDDYAFCVEYSSGHGYTTTGGYYYGTDEGICYADNLAPYAHADAWYQCQLSNFDACFDVCSGTP